MNGTRTKTAAPLLAVLFAACAGVRWSGSPPSPAADDRLHPPPGAAASAPAPEIAMSTAAARRPADEALPEPSALKLRTAAFYSDLGPDSLDISSYPLQQRHNYRVYARACARCHDLSRSLWSPHTAGTWIEFYLMSMRARGRLRGAPFTAEELAAVRDFLHYDAAQRKSGKAFEAQVERLRSRFDAAVDERMDALQKGSPAVRP